MVVLSSILILCSVALISLSILPFFMQRIESWRASKEVIVAQHMDQMFYYDRSPKSIVQLYFILPIILGVAGYFFRS